MAHYKNSHDSLKILVLFISLIILYIFLMSQSLFFKIVEPQEKTVLIEDVFKKDNLNNIFLNLDKDTSIALENISFSGSRYAAISFWFKRNNEDQWHFFAKNGKNNYLDGKYFKDISEIPEIVNSPSNKIIIGNGWAGAIDSIRIYLFYLSEEEILQLNNSGRTIINSTILNYPLPKEIFNNRLNLSSLKNTKIKNNHDLYVNDKEIYLSDGHSREIFVFNKSWGFLRSFEVLGGSVGITGNDSDIWIINTTRGMKHFSKDGILLSNCVFDKKNVSINARGIWTNNTNIWFTDQINKMVYSSNMSCFIDSSKSFSTRIYGNNNPYGITGNGTEFWVIDSGSGLNSIFHYDLKGNLLDSISLQTLVNGRKNSISPLGISKYSNNFYVTVANTTERDIFVLDNVILGYFPIEEKEGTKIFDYSGSGKEGKIIKIGI